jgi:hypothetical protein
MWKSNVFVTVFTRLFSQGSHFTRQSRDSEFYLRLQRVDTAPVCRPGYKYDGEMQQKTTDILSALVRCGNAQRLTLLLILLQLQ